MRDIELHLKSLPLRLRQGGHVFLLVDWFVR